MYTCLHVFSALGSGLLVNPDAMPDVTPCPWRELACVLGARHINKRASTTDSESATVPAREVRIRPHTIGLRFASVYEAHRHEAMQIGTTATSFVAITSRQTTISLRV